MDWKKMQAETEEAMADPRVGDRFTEMYAFWVYVTAIDGDQIVTLEASGPCTFPDDGKQRVQTRDEFRKRFGYGTQPGSWVTLAGRGHDVSGWLRYAHEEK